MSPTSYQAALPRVAFGSSNIAGAIVIWQPLFFYNLMIPYLQGTMAQAPP
ncbi:MAG: hypothetical protein HC780_15355 [Leptolyngbyaceae cyanobacterium CSU_1_3]|nr:hypothetical protein [Leptolyngbyaceae cyanobacterium CSU_1_3]